MRTIPLDRPPQPVAEVGRRPEAEARRGPRDVEPAAWLAVRLRRVERQRAIEPRQLGDQVRQIENADLETGPDVHRLRIFVAFGRADDRVGTVLDVEKLACRRASAPADHFAVAALGRLDTLADQ